MLGAIFFAVLLWISATGYARPGRSSSLMRSIFSRTADSMNCWRV